MKRGGKQGGTAGLYVSSLFREEAFFCLIGNEVLIEYKRPCVTFHKEKEKNDERETAKH